MPGETFSFNKHTGKRSKENGYKSAPVIMEGEMEEDYGGGVCQVSSTLYNSVLYAGLEIVNVKIILYHQVMFQKEEMQLLQIVE